MNIDIDPQRLAKWLQTVLAQRERHHRNMSIAYGEDSAAAREAHSETLDIQTLINLCVKEATKTPLKK